ncbi:hypothetical protein BB8028_0001g15500 [Beauveria bassiana]|uniref:Restriction of telomere capping protein 4 n=1 Tax=Beauveria bassiana TaxID=176275 RepID=A0A2S7Y003_BEABA|nr:hypothetical protein BB8028_0001g15500 [Beauveria bassiana]
MSRRVGLTANAPGLLKTVGNRPRRATRAQPKAPVADDDPPQSSDDGEDSLSEGTVQAAESSDRAASPKRKVSIRRQSSPLDSDFQSSADERSERVAIKSTNFALKSSQAKTTLTKRQRVSRLPEPESPQPKEKLKPGNHLKNKWGLVGQKNQVKTTYGKRTRSSQSSQPGSSQGSNKFHIPSSLESPQKKKPSRFVVPDQKLLSSPGSSPKKLLTDLNGNADSEEDDSILASLRDEKGSKKGKRNPSPPSSPPRAVFKLPRDFLSRSPVGKSLINDSPDESKLSSDDEEDGERSTLKVPEEPSELPPSPSAKCPWCGEAVGRALLDDFFHGRRLNVHMQTRFCQLHKQRAAEQTWRDLGYPTIDWDASEARFAAHREHLHAVIVDGRGSHFREAHARNVEKGSARTMLRRDENFNPGYYGPRGFNAMCDFLVRTFGDALKDRAVDDKVIAGRGSAAFIQAVLVAELGVQLIMEDMELSETEARQVMEDSKGIGELVQPEVEK